TSPLCQAICLLYLMLFSYKFPFANMYYYMYEYALFRLNSQVMLYILAANSKAQRRRGHGLCLGAGFFRVVKKCL
ncbi:MAG: hypothetical protein ACYDIA_25360, partial [Candidatus Humimicrobiaceae bacterium]